jgi:hypothetical protein
MEKVKILRCEPKPTKSGKTFYEISLSDSRKVSGWEDLAEFVNQELDLEITKKGEYWNYKYNKPGKGVGAAPNMKVVAAECTSRAALSNPDEINKILDVYYQWLIKE